MIAFRCAYSNTGNVCMFNVFFFQSALQIYSYFNAVLNRSDRLWIYFLNTYKTHTHAFFLRWVKKCILNLLQLSTFFSACRLHFLHSYLMLRIRSWTSRKLFFFSYSGSYWWNSFGDSSTKLDTHAECCMSVHPRVWVLGFNIFLLQ